MNQETIKKAEKSDFSETLIHSGNYFSAELAAKAIALISIPVFTRFFSQADYGTVAVFDSYVNIMTVVLSLNLYTAVGRYYYEKTDDFGEFLSASLIAVGAVFGVSFCAYILWYRQIAALMNLSGLLPVYLVLASLFAILWSMYYQILIPQKKSREAAMLNILKGLSTFGLAVLLVFMLKENRYLGRIWATVLTGFAFSIYCVAKIRGLSKLSFKIGHLKYMAAYCLPLIPYSLSGIILAQFDRIMVSNIIDRASAGLYSLGYSIGAMLLMVNDATLKALIPDFFRLLDDRQYDRLDVLFKKVISIITVAALGLILFAKEAVLLLADRKFHDGLKVVPAVVIGYVFYGMFYVYGMYPGYMKKTILTPAVALVAGISNIVLNMMLIRRFGYIAAAYTTVASYFLMFVLAWVASKIILKQRVTPLWMIWKPVLIMFGFAAFFYLLDSANPDAVLFFFIKLILLATFGVVVLK